MKPRLHEIICLYSAADDLRFLNTVCNRLAKLLGKDFRLFRLSDKKSCVEAKAALRNAKQGLVLILCHGAETYLRSGEYRHRLTGELVEEDKFLSDQETDVFRGKAVFCLSCDSNGLAQASLASGALAFIGFNRVQFNRFDAAGHPLGSNAFVKHAQGLIAAAVKATLERFVTGQIALDQTVPFLRLWIAKHAVSFVRENQNVVGRQDIAALLMAMRDGIKFHGMRGIKFVRSN